MRRIRCLAATIATAGLTCVASAQYPVIPAEIQEEANARQADARRRSEEAHAKAMLIVEREAAEGRPYLPGAAKPSDLPQARIPAFPGAEGGGMYSFGGRGGKVFVVTNLNDSGPGSFREACEAGGARIVVFNVAGIIRLESKISIRAPYITIAGQSAPGDGVCIAGNTVEIDTHDVVIRHMRFRRGNTDVTERNDALGGNPIGNIMIDHVSASWGLDENMSMYRHMFDHDGNPDTPALKLPTVNITIQNSIFSEGLNTYKHAFGSTIGGYNSTFHRNLWANNTGRNPSVGMNGDFGFFNNVVFNWVHRTTDGGDHLSYYNIINNYWKPGPATPEGPIRHRMLKPEARRSKERNSDFGKAYVAGNVVEGNDAVTNDNWNGGVQLGEGHDPAEVFPKLRVNEPLPHAHVNIMLARQAYRFVLANAGATLPRRDPVDERIVQMVRSGIVPPPIVEPDIVGKLRAVKFSDERIAAIVELGKKGIIYDIAMVGGYPRYEGTPRVDSDSDGMPDEWETRYGLNPNDPSDAAGDLNGDGYTNIEKFLNGLDPTRKIDWTDLRNNVDPLVRPWEQD